jgi:hypothetical protein
MHQAANIETVVLERRVAHEPVLESAQKVEAANIDRLRPGLVNGLLDDLDDAVDDATTDGTNGA